MQKREQSKQGAAAANAGTPAPKRGRPLGSGGGAHSASIAASSDSPAPATLLGPSLQVHGSLADPNNKRIVLALQSGLKTELTWALNALTVLSFKEKDDSHARKDTLAKIPGLLDAILQVIDDWRDIAVPRDLKRNQRVRLLGANSTVTGFGNGYQAFDSVNGNGNGPSATAWWYDEDGLFNLDDEARAEKQQCAVAASNIVRNFSFMADNESIMANHRHCLETMFQCMGDYTTEDEELVTNCVETVVNLAPLLDLRIFGSSKPSFIKITDKQVVASIMGMLDSSVKAWHCGAAELIGRLIINPDNDQFLLPFSAQMYKRMVDLLSFPVAEAQAAAVGALYNLIEVNTDSRLKLAGERWGIDRILKVIKGPHPVGEVCRKASSIMESLASEPQNRSLLLAHENTFAELLFSDGKYSDTFARILYDLTSRPSHRPPSSARCIWGS